jgi:cbb3-type cytochrome oxidase subunit 1
MDRSFDLALLGRFIAICAAAATAYVLRSELQIGYAALGIVAASAILNFGVYWLSPRRFSRFRRRASPIIGIMCWAALMSVTGGISSLFIAGLSMEVVLSMVSLSPLGVVVVSIGAALALVAQQALEGYRGAGYALALHGTFMLVIGLVTAWIASRWRRAEGEFVSQSAELGTRLDSVERELADERTLSQMGERAARLAHGLKNAVHGIDTPRRFISLTTSR